MRAIRLITAAVVTITMVGTLSLEPSTAQDAPKPKPYKPVAITLPQPVKDPSFAAFREQLAQVAKRKDRAALTKLVANNFFWMTDEGKDIADKKRSGGDNVVQALYLDNPESEGWDILAAFAADATGDPLPQRQGVMCSPGEPKYDNAAVTALSDATGTSSTFWYYPASNNVEVRSSADKDSKVTGKLGMHLVWVFPDDSPAAAVHAETVRVVLPSGEFGFVASDSLLPLPGDLLCYSKDGNTWRIAGFFGGMPPEK